MKTKMNLIYVFFVLFCQLGFLLICKYSKVNASRNEKSKNQSRNSQSLKLKSKDIKQNQYINDEFTPHGIDISPSFYWDSTPKDTVSFAFLVDDPDASSLFNHWTIINIPAETKRISQGVIPDNAVAVVNSWGNSKYKGPKPPSKDGDHHYNFCLYALKDKISKGSNNEVPSLSEVRTFISNNLIEKSCITGLYKPIN